jgi:TonB-dependent starch-binding outer membrane protein SusC
MLKFYLPVSRCIAFFLLLLTTTAWSQSRPVTGTIKSSEDGLALPGVSVLEKGTNNGTVTDANGYFSISVGDQATLLLTFIGYKNQEVNVGAESEINISMEEDVTELSEVVVIGYGTVQRKDLTGSVSQVSSEDFNPGINPNPLQAIQGRVAGLTITQPSGDPNQSPNVRLRGYTSLAGGSEPLYVVDGVIGVPINSISPSDIEQIDVLKDASASAIYGSRAANGVIMITTKRGKEGRTMVSYSSYVGIESISNGLDMLGADAYRAEVVRLKGQSALDDSFRFPTDGSGNPYSTDWAGEITRRAISQSHDIAISGGTPEFTYRGSLNYTERQGIITNTGFERLTGRINLDQKSMNDRLNIQYSLAITDNNSENANNNILSRALLYLPTLPVRTATGEYYEVEGAYDLYNPVAMQENYQDDSQDRTLIGAVNIKYEVLKNLTLGASGALRNESGNDGTAYDVNVRAYVSSFPLASRSFDQKNDKLMELTAQYKAELTDLSNLELLGGYSYQEVRNNGFVARNTLGDPSLSGLNLYRLFGYNNLGSYPGTVISPRSDYTGSYSNSNKLISFFGRAVLNLKDKYNFTATVRRDGSSKFGSNNKWGIFPSVAAGWTLSNENFLQGNETLNYLKLRAGWGQTGNSEGIEAYNSLLLYGLSTTTYYDPILRDYLRGLDVTQNSNPDLKWEVLSQINLGVDFELFNGRVDGTIDVYNKTTNDMLYNYTVPLDGVNYFTSNILKNVGSMSNKGIEVSLGSDIIGNNNFRWNVRAIGSAYKNEVTKLSGDDLDAGIIYYNIFNARGAFGLPASQLREGHPLGEFYLPAFRGLRSVDTMKQVLFCLRHPVVVQPLILPLLRNQYMVSVSRATRHRSLTLLCLASSTLHSS